jgi:hypothetical protein
MVASGLRKDEDGKYVGGWGIGTAILATLGTISLLFYCSSALFFLMRWPPEIDHGMVISVGALIGLIMVLCIVWMRASDWPKGYRPPLFLHVLAGLGVLSIALFAVMLFFGVLALVLI